MRATVAEASRTGRGPRPPALLFSRCPRAPITSLSLTRPGIKSSQATSQAQPLFVGAKLALLSEPGLPIRCFAHQLYFTHLLPLSEEQAFLNSFNELPGTSESDSQSYSTECSNGFPARYSSWWAARRSGPLRAGHHSNHTSTGSPIIVRLLFLLVLYLS